MTARIAKTARTSLVCAALLPFCAPGFAQEAPIRIELNRLEAQGENCRTYLLIDNAKGDALRSLKLDIFALDTDGVAAKRIAVEVGPVPEKKRLIKLFDLAGLSCPRVGSILPNDVLACEGAQGPQEGCLSRIETLSKAGPVTFVK
jgi:hypothetical protein